MSFKLILDAFEPDLVLRCDGVTGMTRKSDETKEDSKILRGVSRQIRTRYVQTVWTQSTVQQAIKARGLDAGESLLYS